VYAALALVVVVTAMNSNMQSARTVCCVNDVEVVVVVE
jgi:hypothetical protein